MPPKSSTSKISTEEYDFDFLDDDEEFWNDILAETKTPTKRQAAEVPNLSDTNLTNDAKKTPERSEVSSEDFCFSITDSLMGYSSPEVELKTPTKRQACLSDTNQLMGCSGTGTGRGAKKKKINESVRAFEESRQKALNVMTRQLDARKQVDKKILKNLSDVIKTLEDGALVKCNHQCTTKYKKTLKLFKELHANFKKRFEDADLEQQGEMDKLAEDLAEDVRQYQRKLIEEIFMENSRKYKNS